MSFRLHADLAKKHDGDKIWGYRRVHCADVRLQAHDDESSPSRTPSDPQSVPAELDWILRGGVTSYEESGTPTNSAHVNPYMFTRTLAQLAVDKGVNIIIGSAIDIKQKDGKGIDSVHYRAKGALDSLSATDVILAAGPWTPRLFPALQLSTPRGHSIVVRPSRDLSPYVLFSSISSPPDRTPQHILSPEIYPRPGDALHSFDTVYACGPDDYDIPLLDTTDSVAVDEGSCDAIWTAVGSVSQEIHDGETITKQACYKSQIRPHEEDEEVGPMVGPTGIKGLWLATGHDEWGIQNGPATGLVMSEMIFEGRARSADCESLDPKHFL